MARYRSFLFPEASVGEDVIVLDPRESHHLVRVFRAKAGETVELLDGQGRRYQGVLSLAHAKAAQVAVESVELIERPKPELTLIQALPKGKAMDLILRMATEIGATRIQPVFTDQGEVQIKGERLTSKVEKWRVGMIEACKQCGLAWLPDLAEPIALKTLLASEAATGTTRVVASLEAGSRPLAAVLDELEQPKRIEVAVGPEGDFSAAEYALLSECAFKPVRLGANVLRAETAAAYLLSVVDQLTRAAR
ncbi:RsmE family RNA methyltransferase [Coraliomargarita akajimensis]|uniref:Ribosomal RNA small subunit methyltransferase E n=1 Tax=Coraliomargarita akajimensis (strain DSM 45221 / IAM 15411 / JCM 23193 / KCTC 12865 / 04OKA010-24) TaxID=583355 RepID=D5EIG5_CORAD|nr:RsmE family RNA methyltransferase [Coraliomargarita akajimensis]ADE54231.1 protein of unknown function DUF558 [Coraliomargarita akajimensis DSM 45221]